MDISTKTPYYSNGFYAVDELAESDQKYLDWSDCVEVIDGAVWMYDVGTRKRLGTEPLCDLSDIPATRFVRIGF